MQGQSSIWALVPTMARKWDSNISKLQEPFWKTWASNSLYYLPICVSGQGEPCIDYRTWFPPRKPIPSLLSRWKCYETCCFSCASRSAVLITPFRKQAKKLHFTKPSHRIPYCPLPGEIWKAPFSLFIWDCILIAKEFICACSFWKGSELFFKNIIHL